MNDSSPQHLVAARRQYDQGDTPVGSPGARGLEEFARNSRCMRLGAITAAGLNAFHVAHTVHGTPDHESASPFAEERGRRFETMLMRDDHKRLTDELLRRGLIVTATPTMLDLDVESPSRDDTRERTTALLLHANDHPDDPSLPDLVIHPRMRLQIAGRFHETEPDMLIRKPHGYEVVEIKSYASRDGYTDKAKTGSAARQATIAVIAIQRILQQHHRPAPNITPVVHLVFARMGTDFPDVVTLPVDGEMRNITGALERLNEIPSQVAALAPTLNLADPDSVRTVPANLCDACSHSCSMWHFCRTEVATTENVQMLGDHAADLLRSTESLQHAIDLRENSTPAETDEQAQIAQMLRTAHTAYRQSSTSPMAATWSPDGLHTEQDELDGEFSTLTTDQPQEMI